MAPPRPRLRTSTPSEIFRDYNTNRYHQPSDEYQDSWDFSGLEEMARFGFTLGNDAANLPAVATWNKGDEFLPVREKSLKVPK